MAKATQEYELKPGCAKHYLRDRTVVNPGDVVESAVDLAAAFPNKFRRYGEQVQKTAVNRRHTKKPAETASADVTAEFTGAEEAGVQVLKQGRKYLVLDSDGAELTDGAVSKAAAASVIADQLEPDTDEDEDGEE